MVQLENVRFSGTGLRFWPCWISLHNEIAVSEYPEEYSEGNIEWVYHNYRFIELLKLVNISLRLWIPSLCASVSVGRSWWVSRVSVRFASTSSFCWASWVDWKPVVAPGWGWTVEQVTSGDPVLRRRLAYHHWNPGCSIQSVLYGFAAHIVIWSNSGLLVWDLNTSRFGITRFKVYRIWAHMSLPSS